MARIALVLAGFWIAFAVSAARAQDDTATSFEDEIAGLERQDGLIPLYVDADEGRILAELSEGEDGTLDRVIYTARLTSGLGSNPVGLDRGLGTGSSILAFTRVGDAIFAEFENTLYRAIGAGPDEAAATRDSFARSIIWQTDIVAERDGQVLIDLSGFLERDPIGAAQQLSDTGQGEFSIDAARSTALFESALAFPRNIEIDALLTLSAGEPGPEVAATAPSPHDVTLTVHHSFLALPEPGYTPRLADPRSGAFEMAVYDMAAPLDAPIRQGFAMRHRLNRADPNASSGPVTEPIVYYVDRGAPPIIRDALIEGGNWWADAFADAGFEDAFRVELLPEGVHPLDARYNVIQWVHRQTRGWSYGASVYDPRTGEILKGHVILGSQRVRQDRMIFEGLLGRAATGTGQADDPLELALDRVRQLSAHEIGHTLGLMHNVAASVNDRASVMDYPAPLITLDEAGRFDTSQAYDTGIGEWDRLAITWLYADPQSARGPQDALDRAHEAGLLFISDAHARSNSTGHPYANLWDNGSDPAAMLRETLRVREAALARFGRDRIDAGQPLSALRDVFPPIYLYHRYQVEAVAKALGGVNFAYALAGSGAGAMTPFPAEAQREALDTLLLTLDPARLDISDDTLGLLVPSPFADYDPIERREQFESGQYPAFSRADAAAAAARITLTAMLDPARIARMDGQAARDPGQLSAEDVFDDVEAVLFEVPRGEAGRLVPVREAVQREYVAGLLRTAASDTPMAAALARSRLTRLEDTLDRRGPGRSSQRLALTAMIESGLTAIDEGRTVTVPATDIPPGSPIGAQSCFHCDSADILQH
jgi:hypothetical protein